MEQQEKEAKRVTINDLRESNVDWKLFFDKPKANATKACKIPFPHQKLAIQSTVKGLQKNKRGQLIMACGSGKTITAQRIDEKLDSKLTLVLVPSLLLVQQTLKSWREESQKDFLSMAVCSDDTVTNDSAVGRVRDLSIPVTTNSSEIKEFLKLKGRKVIFSTYQSSSKIAKAIKGTKYKFDLVIADEAHRLAGTVDKQYGSVLQKNALPSKYYLFMTATPRIFTANVQKTASERGVEVYSMNDVTIFGKELHNYSFADAIKDGILTDYRVVVVGVDDPMLADMIDQRELVRAGDIDTDAKTLASHIGLAKAMRDYELNRVISFHSRIKSAKNFAETHPRIRDWMKEPNIKSTNLTTLTISGQDSSDERKRVLDQLKEVDLDSQGLVTNARCLTEGVDVPTLDGIAFIDPKASQVDIVQAVGRAIRKGGDEKKFGYIVIPIFFSQKEINEEIINESAFKPIWEVINALKSHDSKLKEEIDQLRIDMGRLVQPKNISEKIIVEIPKEISLEFNNKINTFLIEKVSNSWLQYYGAMLQYCEKYKSLPSVTYINDSKLKLGSWKSEQKKSYKQENLSSDRIKMLENIPLWSWNEWDDRWSNYFDELVRYREKYNKIPSIREEGKQAKLGQWVGDQRERYRTKKLSSERVELLESVVGWNWSPLTEIQERILIELENYSNEFGHINVPARYKTKTGYTLGSSISKIRKRKNVLSKDLIAELEKYPNWIWGSPLDVKWEKAFQELEEYSKNIGNTFIHIDYKTRSGFNLGLWVAHQRKDYRDKKNRMSKYRINKLESIPTWIWHNNAQEQNWNVMYELLKKHVGEKGFIPPKSFIDENGIKLGIWVTNQRSYQSKSKLSKDKFNKLDKIKIWKWKF